MSKTPVGNEGAYAHIFAYCLPKKNHAQMLDTETKLGTIYKRHGSLSMNLYVWDQTTIFQGFAGLDKQLGATPNDELWLEIDSYKNGSNLNRVMEKVREDPQPRPLWEKLSQLVGSGRSIAMGEFNRVSET
jgi:hypothetical protein